jgi:hypothetical protein
MLWRLAVRDQALCAMFHSRRQTPRCLLQLLAASSFGGTSEAQTCSCDASPPHTPVCARQRRRVTQLTPSKQNAKRNSANTDVSDGHRAAQRARARGRAGKPLSPPRAFGSAMHQCAQRHSCTGVATPVHFVQPDYDFQQEPAPIVQME